jgi:hypothetical protein
VSLHGAAKANRDTQEHENQYENKLNTKQGIQKEEIGSFNPIFQ